MGKYGLKVSLKGRCSDPTRSIIHGPSGVHVRWGHPDTGAIIAEAWVDDSRYPLEEVCRIVEELMDKPVHQP